MVLGCQDGIEWCRSRLHFTPIHFVFQFLHLFLSFFLFACTKVHIHLHKLSKLQLLDFRMSVELLKLLNVMESHQRSINNVVYHDRRRLRFTYTPFSFHYNLFLAHLISPDLTLPYPTMEKESPAREITTSLSPQWENSIHFPQAHPHLLLFLLLAVSPVSRDLRWA